MPSTFSLIVDLPANSTSYTDTALTVGTLFVYHVHAYNVAGSNDFTGVTLSTVSLPPTFVCASGAAGEVQLSWQASAGAVTYSVYRSLTSGGEGNIPVITGLTATTYSDPSLAGGTTYYYQITAVNSGGESTRSEEVSATTLGALVATYVINLTVTDNDGSTGTDSKTISVTNVNPMATISGAPTNSPEGSAITLNSSVSDLGIVDTFTYAWTVTKNGSAYASGSASSLTFTPNDNGTYVVSLTVTDQDGGIGTDSNDFLVLRQWIRRPFPQIDSTQRTSSSSQVRRSASLGFARLVEWSASLRPARSRLFLGA